MKIKLICIGKTSENYLKEGEDVFLKRLTHYCNFEKIIIPDNKKNKSLSIQEFKKKEGEIILKKIQKNDFVILLDEKGDQFSSVQLSKFIENHFIKSSQNLVFIIGGAFGFSQELYSSCNKKISLSKLTFSHQMVRLFFLEQLYRSMTIIKNENYHNE